jgi:EAL domain-containing protein (putative c-di-GMP-specific phosphodiesterase class I)
MSAHMTLILPNVPLPDPSEWSDPLSAAVAERDGETLRMVEDALRNRRVRLAYQPVVPAGNPVRPVFYEGLARILDPTGRPIPAADFMGAVELQETGRVIDALALELGLKVLHAHPGIRLSVNMSARSIGYPRWMRTLEAGLSADPSLAARLILEITESSAMLIPDIVSVFMADLQARGVRFALDDFGQGFTSFRYLRDFDFDILKIDGQFIRGVATDPDNQVLTRALVSIAGHFQMLTVAESVETPADAAWLAQAGVDCLQGYHFGAPALRPAWSDCEERRAV